MRAAEVKVLRAGDGEVLGPPDGVRDRFVLAAAESDLAETGDVLWKPRGRWHTFWVDLDVDGTRRIVESHGLTF
jgi:hypothetical protein